MKIMIALFTLILFFSVQWSDIPTLTANGICAGMVLCFNIFSVLMSPIVIIDRYSPNKQKALWDSSINVHLNFAMGQSTRNAEIDGLLSVSTAAKTPSN